MKTQFALAVALISLAPMYASHASEDSSPQKELDRALTEFQASMKKLEQAAQKATKDAAKTADVSAKKAEKDIKQGLVKALQDASRALDSTAKRLQEPSKD